MSSRVGAARHHGPITGAGYCSMPVVDMVVVGGDARSIAETDVWGVCCSSVRLGVSLEVSWWSQPVNDDGHINTHQFLLLQQNSLCLLCAHSFPVQLVVSHFALVMFS